MQLGGPLVTDLRAFGSGNMTKSFWFNEMTSVCDCGEVKMRTVSGARTQTMSVYKNVLVHGRMAKCECPQGPAVRDARAFPRTR